MADQNELPGAGMINFERDWSLYYPGYYPIGYMLRTAGARHWLRFHSLIDSKRYADTDDERQALLSRQEELASEILGYDNPCWLVQTRWQSQERAVDIADADDLYRAQRDHDIRFSFRFCDDDIPQNTWDVYAAATHWEPSKFSELLLAIADEKAVCTLWLSTAGAVFAPYDGGVDLFLPTLAEAERLRTAHPNWLSRRPDGL